MRHQLRDTHLIDPIPFADAIEITRRMVEGGVTGRLKELSEIPWADHLPAPRTIVGIF